ncbi:MAG: molybdopterin-dependent oxidoreductase [Gammaproteobacteria bacterium]|nr:molybdopterin-dependent oxidoreductase [Gammaproteobacteria bacterium]
MRPYWWSNNPSAGETLRQLVSGIDITDDQRRVAAELQQGNNKTVLLGVQAMAHPEFSVLRALAGEIAELTGARFGYLSESANSTGAWLAGAVPHRGPLGATVAEPGLHARAMFEQPRRAYCLLGLEPDRDCWNSRDVIKALQEAECVVAFSAYQNDTLQACADILLPLGLYAETAGSFVNIEGRLQSFNGAVSAPGLARPGWKILRVLGNLFNLEGFDYEGAGDVRTELADDINRIVDGHSNSGWRLPSALPAASGGRLERVTFVPMNSLDPLVRHAHALQATFDVADGRVHVHPDVAQRLGLQAGGRVRVNNSTGSAELPVVFDDQLAADCVLIHATHPDAVELGGWFGEIDLQRSGT